MNIYINESQLKRILAESSLITEAKNLVDNFNEIAKYIDNHGTTGDPDQFYYIEIKKRFKDNPTLYQQYKAGTLGNVNSDKYGVYLASFRAHNGQELLKLKSQIVSICDSNNARAYITQNPRSEQAVKNYAQHPKFKNNKFPLADPENIASGEQQTPFDRHGNLVGTKQSMIQRYGSDRSGFFFDIDAKDKRIAELTKIILKHYNINVTAEKSTPSGGIHIICDNVFDPNLKQAMEMLKVFDAGQVDIHTKQKSTFPDLGQNQLVHANIDGKFILYSNVSTKGY
jgi:hypothetical protein